MKPRHPRDIATTHRHALARIAAVAAWLLLIAAPPSMAQVRQDSTGAATKTAVAPDTTRATKTAVAPDTTGAARDSVLLRGARTGADTTITFARKNSVDTLVAYSARDTILYDLPGKTMRLFGKAEVQFGSFTIKAERITVNWDNSTIVANGIPDSANAGKFTGTPVFKEGADEYLGETMSYNFKSRKGVITQGKTTIDNGYYIGERIKRMSENAYFIANGKYTTCDNPDHKHYYFGSPKMKVVPKDMIIAEPVIFFIEDIPIFAIPFAAIPSKGGRQSGLIIPTFGDFPSRGRFLKGGGYYWAASDYWDLRLTGDWYSKGGYQVEANVQYALRYRLTGSITAAYGRQTFNIGNPFLPDDLPTTDYRLAITHNQQLTPTSNITANVSLQSNSYYTNNSVNMDQLLTQRVISQASYTTSWEQNRSMSVFVSRDQDLRQGTSTTVLPDVTFSQSQVFPFRRSGSTEQAWYELIGFNYSGQARNQSQSIIATRDTSRVKESYDRRGIRHSLNLIATPKLGFVTISPSFNYEEKWYDHRIERSFRQSDSTIQSRDVNGFFTARSFGLGVSASTKLYGMFQPNVAGILAIRHTIQPSVSYHFNPDFTSRGWGDQLRYTGINNTEVKYDPYSGYDQKPGEVFGGSGGTASQSIGFSVGNLFEMKLKPAAGDTSETPRKFQLLNVDLSTAYDLERDSLRLSQISLNYRTSVQGVLDLSGGAHFSPYVFDHNRTVIDYQGRPSVQPGEVNRWMISNGQGIARLTDFNLSLSTTLSSEMFTPKKSPADSTAALAAPIPKSGDAYNFSIPWSVNLFYSYSINQFDPRVKSRASTINASLTISPTPNWKLTARAFYDLVTNELSAPEINISRDLHCWQMNFNWVPTGIYRRFYLVIQIKAPQLKDIKLERQGSDREIP